MRGAQTGDEAAFASLYERVLPALITWARLRLAEGSAYQLDPEELVQEIWVRAMGAFGDYDEERGTFRVWIFGIATRTLLELLRKAALRKNAQLLTDGDYPEIATSISQRIARDEDLARFAEKLLALEGEDRQLLLYRGLEGLPHDEVATRLGINRDAATKRWHRLRARLLEGEAPDSVLEA